MAAKKSQGELCDAIRNGDTETVETVLQRLPEMVNCKYETVKGELTPLIEACQQGELEVVKVLLKHGADVEARGYITQEKAVRREGGYGALDDVFPLFMATRGFHLRIVDALLDAGAPVDQTNAIGQSSLHVALFYPFNSLHGEASLADMLIKHGVDINQQDRNGRTPLHYACEHSNNNGVRLLLKNGAQFGLTDNRGFSALEVAAHSSESILIEMLELCEVTVRERIEAFETIGLFPYCKSRYQWMQKATALREQHGIPKTVLEPMECYGFVKEWETMEELKACALDCEQLRLQSILAWERIYQDRCKDLTDTVPIEALSALDEDDHWTVNALLKHQLALFRENNIWLYFTSIFSTYRNPAHQYFNLLETETVVEFIKVAIESCQKIQDTLQEETKPSCSQQLTLEFQETLRTAGRSMSDLIKRNKQLENKTEKSIVRELLQEVLEKFPRVLSLDGKCVMPLPHVLVSNFYSNPVCYSCGQLPYDCELLEILIDSGFNLDITDNDGNTLLHAFVETALSDINYYHAHGHGYIQNIISDTKRTIALLLRKGAYLHARNNKKQSILDKLHDPVNNHVTAEVIDEIKKYDQLPALLHISASKVRDSNLPYKALLPESLTKFVDIH